MTNTPYVHQDWPSYRYGPNGAAEIFQNGSEVPKGWVDHPAKLKTKDAAPADDVVKTPAKRLTAAEKRALADAEDAAALAAKQAADEALDEKTDEELSEILLTYGLASDGADRETILTVIRDERAKG